jgi:hypothetical protein
VVPADQPSVGARRRARGRREDESALRSTEGMGEGIHEEHENHEGDAGTQSETETDGEVRNMGVKKMKDRKMKDRKMRER